MTVATYDGRLRQTGRVLARWSTAGGNGSEVQLRATNDGRLLELGGDHPFVSSDGGRTWQHVVLPVPAALAGEGAVVAGHGRDVHGVVWNPYSGDSLATVAYDPTSGWTGSYVTAHAPLYDRPWISYAQGSWHGPQGGSDFVTLIHGNPVHGPANSLLSLDGRSYLPTFPDRADPASRAPLALKVTRNPDADQWQPVPWAWTVPLTAGGLLLMDNEQDRLPCKVEQLRPDLTWQCVQLPFAVTGTLRQDSRGWLTMLSDLGTGFELALSPDGGRTWRTTELAAPHGGRAGGTFHADIVVNGRRGEAVVASRFLDSHLRGQDLVWLVDISRTTPSVKRVYEVGRGDDVAPGGLDASKAASATDRVDFPTVALLPDGSIATGFTDSTTSADDGNQSIGHAPAIAVVPR